jgi:two-component system response regulator AtoC
MAAAASLDGAGLAVKQTVPGVVLIDVRLPAGNGVRLFEDTENNRTVVFVLMTGSPPVDTIIASLRQEATDYLTRPVQVGRLKALLGDVAWPRASVHIQPSALSEAGRTGVFGQLLGRSASMLTMYRQVHRVAPTNATVLLSGETGTGKELVAREIHELSDRRGNAFIPLNCGAISAMLIESELFGHEQGSFTGATRRHNGVFERADRGTLFLDEITEMPLDLQIKLLRVLETGRFNRIGGEKPVQTDVRVIAATNCAPGAAVRAGKLRQDLFYRLQVFPIVLPPLREREGDIALLAEHFLGELNRRGSTSKRLSVKALERLQGYSWPGNVRELRNLIQRAHILEDQDIDAEFLSPPKACRPDGEVVVGIRVGASVAQAEELLIEATMLKFQGDKKRAASMLGMSFKTLYTRLNVYRARARG